MKNKRADLFDKYFPVAPNSKKDLFHGNILAPGEFIFAYILIYVVIIAFAVFVTYFIVHDQKNTAMEAVFYDCIMDGEEIDLLSDDDQRYTITEVPGDFNFEQLKSICDGQTVLAIQAREYNDEDGEPYFSVREIIAGGEEILSAKCTAKVRLKGYFLIALFPVGFFLLWTALVVGSVITGRHPGKYPKLVKLFFKPEYILFYNK